MRSKIPNPELTGTIARRALLAHAAFGLVLPTVTACDVKPMYATIDISLVSYLDRAIFEVLLNGKDVGLAPAYARHGTNGVMVDERIKLGPQVVTWRLGGPRGMARNGEMVRAKNTPVLEQVPPGSKWMAVNIYDDGTVELTFTKRDPEDLETERGRKILAGWDKHGL